MINFYLEQADAGSWTITGYGDEGEVSKQTYFSLYNARMALYALEDEGYWCKDCTR
jgi:hypothetical protein